MRLVLLVAVVAIGSARADVLRSITAQNDPLSSLYGISRVHEASTPTEDVRVYTMSIGGDFSRETLVLHIAAAPRPYKMLRDVVLWNLGDVLRSVESIGVLNDIVTIRGSSNNGVRECRYAFGFNEGRLSKELNTLGCDEAP